MTAEDRGELVGAFEAFRSRGTTVVFDPGPWFFLAVSKEQVLDAWQRVDCRYCRPRACEAVEALVERLLAEGPGRVVVKCGGEGAAFGGRDECVGTLKTERVDQANTVGAGDTFNAGLIHGLCQGKRLEDAIRIGLRLATGVVKRGRGVLAHWEIVDFLHPEVLAPKSVDKGGEINILGGFHDSAAFWLRF